MTHPLEDVQVTTHHDRIYLSVRNTETAAMTRPDIADLIDRLCEAVKEVDR